MNKKVWVTKYALTAGVKQCRVDSVSERDGKYVYVKWDTDSVFKTQVIMGRTCFDTEREANLKAVEMAYAKLRSIAKQKSKLEMMAEEFNSKAHTPTGKALDAST